MRLGGGIVRGIREPAKERVPGFAIVRVDHSQQEDERRFTVRQIVWEQATAESEVRRLNEVNPDKGCTYLSQYTLVDRPG